MNLERASDVAVLPNLAISNIKTQDAIEKSFAVDDNSDPVTPLTEKPKRKQRAVLHLDAESFPQFPKLPTELRVKIFRTALPPATKVLVNTASKTPTGFHCSRRPPVMLSVDRESRHETLKHYRILLHNNKHQIQSAFFDPSIDTVCFPQLSPLIDGIKMVKLPPAVRNSIQLLEFNHMWWSDGFNEAINGPRVSRAADPPKLWILPMFAPAYFNNLRRLRLNSCNLLGNSMNRPGGAAECSTEVAQHFKQLKEANPTFTVPEVIVEMGDKKMSRSSMLKLIFHHINMDT